MDDDWVLGEFVKMWHGREQRVGRGGDGDKLARA